MNLQTITTFEQSAKSVLDRIVSGYKALQADPTVDAIEAKWPLAAGLAHEIGLIVPFVGEAEMTADFLLNFGPKIYALTHAIGLGMTAEDTAKLRQQHIDEAAGNG